MKYASDVCLYLRGKWDLAPQGDTSHYLGWNNLLPKRKGRKWHLLLKEVLKMSKRAKLWSAMHNKCSFVWCNINKVQIFSCLNSGQIPEQLWRVIIKYLYFSYYNFIQSGNVMSTMAVRGAGKRTRLVFLLILSRPNYMTLCCIFTFSGS